MVKEVIESVVETRGAHLLLVSIIPSPENHYYNGPVVKLADDEMRKLANLQPTKVTFLDLSNNFLRNRQLNPELFDQSEKTPYQDPVHLSKTGAAMVATKLRQKCMSIPKNYFKIE